ncbi:MAG: hypothetical protein ACE5HO_06330 [bacterium]
MAERSKNFTAHVARWPAVEEVNLVAFREAPNTTQMTYLRQTRAGAWWISTSSSKGLLQIFVGR